jgi:hypothetical protein
MIAVGTSGNNVSDGYALSTRISALWESGKFHVDEHSTTTSMSAFDNIELVITKYEGLGQNEQRTPPY